MGKPDSVMQAWTCLSLTYRAGLDSLISYHLLHTGIEQNSLACSIASPSLSYKRQDGLRGHKKPLMSVGVAPLGSNLMALRWSAVGGRFLVPERDYLNDPVLVGVHGCLGS